MEDVFKYYCKHYSNYYLFYRHVSKLELTLPFMIFAIGAILTWPNQSLIWALSYGVFMILYFNEVIRCVAQKHYNTKVIFFKCSQIYLIARKEFIIFLANRGMLKVTKLMQLRDMIENQIKETYIEKISVPTVVLGLFIIPFKNFIAWIYSSSKITTYDEARVVFVAWLLIILIFAAYWYLVASVYSMLFRFNRASYKRLLSEIDEIIMEIR